MDALDRYGGLTWFRLGDRDLATHLYRTHRLRERAALSEVTGEITRAWDLDVTLVPATDDPLRTMVTVAGDGEIGFQDYFVRLQHGVEVEAVRFDGADSARPAPGVLEAIDEADVVVVAPSNPVVSIDPVLAVKGIRDAITARRSDTVAVSPIIAGAALKGPADRLLTELGHEPSATGIARYYRELVGTLVIDEADRALEGSVRDVGVGCVVTNTIMATPERAARLAQTVLDAVA
jgi:LPPG:FO 2-phospho-L-lactate transferase